ncbi:MAG TPA: alpha-L-fucosidase [Chitinophagaceae bacterium]|nr:alpha-L-fucosidase [Chitinophagaceae bacterium]
MKTGLRNTLALIGFLLTGSLILAQPATKTLGKFVEEFRDRRFGMFIHWGPVTLRGTEIGWSRGEQVPTSEYDNLYKEFNPVLFNADAWVKAAKDAGMKYLTITAKHHDGFCLWPTAASDYNIMHSPFKRDIVGELATACRKQDISFCIYCTVLDWHDPDYPVHRMGKDTTGNMTAFVKRMKAELKELITRYHPAMLWFDGYWEKPWTVDYGNEIYRYIKSIDAGIVVNNRLGKDFSSLSAPGAVGDFLTPEQEIGKLNMTEPWESCMTIAEQWAWKPNDKMKSLKQCIQNLVRAASGNGNFLFNVGPMPDGRMEARQLERLKEMGDWLKIYGESIYGTRGGPFVPVESYGATRKGLKIYVHVFERKDKTLNLPALPGITIKKAYFLKGKPVVWQQTDAGIALQLPSSLPDASSNVIVLETDKSTESIPVAGN